MPDLAHDAYNVCSGAGTAVGALLTWVLEAAGVDPEVVQDPELLRPDEPETVVGDPARLRQATDWHLERNLHTCAGDTFNWHADLGVLRPADEDG